MILWNPRFYMQDQENEVSFDVGHVKANCMPPLLQHFEIYIVSVCIPSLQLHSRSGLQLSE